MKNTKPKRKFWIFLTYYECPVCGRGKEYRERRYTPKPATGRSKYIESYDWCLEFGNQ